MGKKMLYLEKLKPRWRLSNGKFPSLPRPVLGGGGSVTYMAVEVRGKHRVCNSLHLYFLSRVS